MATGVVTPEAVVLELPVAGVATRGFARGIDLGVQAFVGGVLALGAAALIGRGLSPVLAFLVVVVATLVVWPVLVEVLWRGRSVGKAVFSLRVIGVDGSPVQPRQSIVRALVALVDIYLSFGFLAVVSAMFSPAAQRPGDLAASTVVVREPRGSAAEVPIVFFPPEGFESYVATLDVGRLEPEDFSVVRSFLLRVRTLTGVARVEQATALAEAVRTRIRHELPGPVDPETWLVCVAAAHQWREGGLLREVALGQAPVAPVAPSGPVPNGVRRGR